MSIQAIGLKAYAQALNNFNKAKAASPAAKNVSVNASHSFDQTLSASLKQVNALQQERSDMINAFASGESQNVHELMISMQKASLAMNMTAAVRNKVIEAYRELSRMQF